MITYNKGVGAKKPYTSIAEEALKYSDFIKDLTKNKSKLTLWEEMFADDLRNAYLRGLITTRDDLTHKMLEVVERLEKKMYSA